MKQSDGIMKSRRKKGLIKHIKDLTIAVFAIIGLAFCLNTFAQNVDELKFIQFSDVHYSQELDNTPYKLRKSSPELFDDAIAQANEASGLSFVMITGDLVDRAKESELEGFLEHAKNIKAPWYFAFGNHDSMLGANLTPEKYLEKVKKANSNIKTDKTYYSFSPKNGYKVIVLDSIIRDRLTSNGEIPQAELEWLDKELSASQKQIVLIFLHVPIQEPIAEENHKLLNAQEVMKVLGKYKNPIAVFQGHYHVSRIRQSNNLLFVSTPALVSYPNAFREIKITNESDKVTFDIKTKNTRLTNLRNQAKLFILSPSIPEGEESDQNGIYVITKKK